MVTVDNQKKVVVITNEGPISSATFHFNDLKRLERINKKIYDEVITKVIEEEKKVDPSKSLVEEIERKVNDGLSKIHMIYDIIVNKNKKEDHNPENRVGCPGFVAIYKVTPDNLYMSAWDDWSSGYKLSWDLTDNCDSLIQRAKSCAADNTEVWIKDAETKEIIFYHRGPKY